MKFSEKLQSFRKNMGITQKELAERLCVSRTAVSKWESDRGYPNIESLKDIAKFFSVSIDELLSTDEVISMAVEDKRKRERHARDLLFGVVDLCMAMLLFLPFFAEWTGESVRSLPLVSLVGVRLYLKIAYLAAVISVCAIGALTLILRECGARAWLKTKGPLSLVLGSASVLVFAASSQPYAAAFAFLLLAIKAAFAIKLP